LSCAHVSLACAAGIMHHSAAGLTAGLGRPSSLAPGPRSAKLSGGALYGAIGGALDDRMPAIVLAAIPKSD